ncbi:TatD family hydrolase [Candidatus Parcubacteria bacterium]|nr:TatD family hydrolase [Candidatus Parcubacteria bacterium]
MLIDTHAHLNLNAFKDDADEVIRRALQKNTWMINVGADFKSSRRALDYANKYERGVFAAVGLHPMHLFKFNAKTDEYDFTTRGEEFNYDAYEQLAKFSKVVAVGEVGLDFYHMDIGVAKDKIMKLQKDILWQQLLLARRLDLPLILHSRKSYDCLVELIRRFKKEHRDLMPKNKSWGVVHCFEGNEDEAWQFFNLGLIISFTGLITFSKRFNDLIRRLPNDKFMIETDCPFLAPEPCRGQRNEPLFVKHIAERIAEIKNLSLEQIAEITTQNARKFFNI